MAEEKFPSERAESLRHRAAAGRAEEPDARRPEGDLSAAELAHELQVHQLELEAQNEDLRRTQQELQESLDLYNELYNRAPIGFLTLDPKRHMHHVNLNAARLLGAEPPQLEGRRLAGFVDADDQEAFHLHCRQALETQEVQTCELRLQPASGPRLDVMLQTVVAPVERMGPGCLHVVLEDISQRRRAAEQIRRDRRRLRSMVHALTLAEERERRRIATDLHDSACQLVALAQMKVSELRQQRPAGSVALVVEELAELLEQTDQTIRLRIFDLSPPVLYHSGLAAALKWLAEDFGDRHLLQVEVDDDGQSEVLDNDLLPLTYRAVRELLMNVMKHAGTGRARLVMRHQEDRLHLEVIDEGSGLDLDKLEDNAGFGLFAIRERMEMIGGRCHLESEPGKGTRVRLEVPLSATPDTG